MQQEERPTREPIDLLLRDLRTTADGLGTRPPAKPSRIVPRRVGAVECVWVKPPWVCSTVWGWP